MENLDLNIENYELEDILNLFQLSYDFNEVSLKKAKHIVKRTHPDKSKLKPEIFIFFLRAYNVLYYLYEFRNRVDQKECDYKNIINEANNDENIGITISKFKNHEDFNNIFNELFESNKLKDQCNETGYEEWFKSNEDVCDVTVSGTREMTEFIMQQKEKASVLVKHTAIEELADNTSYELSRDAPTNYSSSIFSKLGYEDLKKAHQETLIPVTEKDFNDREKYNSLTHILQKRSEQNTEPLSLIQSKQFITERETKNKSIDTMRAFKLAKQTEEALNIQKRVLYRFNELGN